MDIFQRLNVVNKVRPKSTKIDNLVFNLHYKVTTISLCFSAGMVMAKEYFGDAINCIVKDDVPSSLMNTYCWSHSTFILPRACNKTVGLEVVHPCIDKYSDNSEEERVYHNYYQWVSLVLFIQAGCFYLPHIVWIFLEGKVLHKLTEKWKSVYQGVPDRQITINANEENLQKHKDAIKAQKETIEILQNLQEKLTQPEVVEEDTRPKVVEEDTRPEVVQEHTQPEVVQEHTQPEVVQEHTQPEVVQEHTQPEVVEEDTQPEVVQEHTQPEVVQEHTQPEVVQEHTQPEVVEEDTRPKVVEEHLENFRSKLEKAQEKIEDIHRERRRDMAHIRKQLLEIQQHTKAAGDKLSDVMTSENNTDFKIPEGWSEVLEKFQTDLDSFQEEVIGIYQHDYSKNSNDSKDPHYDSKINFLILFEFFNNNRQPKHYLDSFLFCELLNFFNVVAQIILIDKFVGGTFISYGLNVINFSILDQDQRIDPMIQVFPLITKCSFRRFGPSGDIAKYDALCLLPLNVMNQKIFILMWFWFVLLAVITFLALIYRFSTFSPRFRSYIHPLSKQLDKKHLRSINRNDWFFLYMLKQNMNREVYLKLLEELSIIWNKGQLPIGDLSDFEKLL